jgi:murein DD-endopeptidase MepM/ murein hydrolase activator NlpD
LQYLMLGVPLRDCFGWGRPIYSATDGVVVEAQDGWPERDPVHLSRDAYNMVKNARAFRAEWAAGGRSLDVRLLTGNHIIVESPVGFVLYAHAQAGSIGVAVGERVSAGQPLAKVGHSGNSTAPHLHFHVMDRLDPWTAQGISCCFRDYEVFDGQGWKPVHNGIPTAAERIRK